MKFPHALLISVGFSLASWVPFYALPDTVYELRIQGQYDTIQFEKRDVAALWLALTLFMNPFPWLMWKILIGLLHDRDQEIRNICKEHEKNLRLREWMEENNLDKGKW